MFKFQERVGTTEGAGPETGVPEGPQQEAQEGDQGDEGAQERAQGEEGAPGPSTSGARPQPSSTQGTSLGDRLRNAGRGK